MLSDVRRLGGVPRTGDRGGRGAAALDLQGDQLLLAGFGSEREHERPVLAGRHGGDRLRAGLAVSLTPGLIERPLVGDSRNRHTYGRLLADQEPPPKLPGAGRTDDAEEHSRDKSQP